LRSKAGKARRLAEVMAGRTAGIGLPNLSDESGFAGRRLPSSLLLSCGEV
jgi:hypothetical protein